MLTTATNWYEIDDMFHVEVEIDWHFGQHGG